MLKNISENTKNIVSQNFSVKNSKKSVLKILVIKNISLKNNNIQFFTDILTLIILTQTISKPNFGIFNTFFESLKKVFGTFRKFFTRIILI